MNFSRNPFSKDWGGVTPLSSNLLSRKSLILTLLRFNFAEHCGDDFCITSLQNLWQHNLTGARLCINKSLEQLVNPPSHLQLQQTLFHQCTTCHVAIPQDPKDTPHQRIFFWLWSQMARSPTLLANGLLINFQFYKIRKPYFIQDAWKWELIWMNMCIPIPKLDEHAYSMATQCIRLQPLWLSSEIQKNSTAPKWT